MKTFLSIAGIALVAFTLTAGPMSTPLLIMCCVLLAICIVGLVYWGYRSPKILPGSTVYYGGEAYTVIRAFDSFFDIPESIKCLPGPKLRKDSDMMNQFLVIVRGNAAVLTPYFSTVNTYDHSEQDRRAEHVDQPGTIQEKIYAE